jgi:hypothetical protein
MRPFANSVTAWTKGCRHFSRLSLLLVLAFCLGIIPHAHASATLLLEEPYSYDGAFAGTGHVAVYLSNVCAASPVVLRRCAAGEPGVVLSRYDGIGGYDWVAIPLIPYLYAVDRTESVPLFADPKLVVFMRDQYRREYLSTLAPDLSDGAMPAGNWYELVGASYDRTIYGYQIQTSPAQDALLIKKLNTHPNLERYHFIKRNCADFVKDIINFYYPHALHRSIIGDLGVTTPKQIAKMLASYSKHHPELQSSKFVVPQVPGSVRRSAPVHGVLESVMAAKKYMIPLIALNPYIAGGLVIQYFGRRSFDPGKNALILDSAHQLDEPMTRADRMAYQSRMEEISQAGTKQQNNEARTWERMQANAGLGLDAARQPYVQVWVGEDLSQVGLARGNILSGSESSDLAAKLLEARIRQELRPAVTRKTSRSDVERDLTLFEQLISTHTDEARQQAAQGIGRP